MELYRHPTVIQCNYTNFAHTELYRVREIPAVTNINLDIDAALEYVAV